LNKKAETPKWQHYNILLNFRGGKLLTTKNELEAYRGEEQAFIVRSFLVYLRMHRKEYVEQLSTVFNADEEIAVKLIDEAEGFLKTEEKEELEQIKLVQELYEPKA
jgi:hypothetical protein